MVATIGMGKSALIGIHRRPENSKMPGREDE